MDENVFPIKTFIKLLALCMYIRECFRGENKLSWICNFCDRNKQTVPAVHELARSGARSAPERRGLPSCRHPQIGIKK